MFASDERKDEDAALASAGILLLRERGVKPYAGMREGVALPDGNRLVWRVDGDDTPRVLGKRTSVRGDIRRAFSELGIADPWADRRALREKRWKDALVLTAAIAGAVAATAASVATAGAATPAAVATWAAVGSAASAVALGAKVASAGLDGDGIADEPAATSSSTSTSESPRGDSPRGGYRSPPPTSSTATPPPTSVLVVAGAGLAVVLALFAWSRS